MPDESDENKYNYLDIDTSDKSNMVMQILGSQDATSPHSMILNSGATSTVLKHKCYFTKLTPTEYSIATMSGQNLHVKGHGPATFLLPEGTRIYCNKALYIPAARRQVLCDTDIANSTFELHMHVHDGPLQYKTLTNEDGLQLEKFYYQPSGLIEFNISTDQLIAHTGVVTHDACLWHDRLGHPSR